MGATDTWGGVLRNVRDLRKWSQGRLRDRFRKSRLSLCSLKSAFVHPWGEIALRCISCYNVTVGVDSIGTDLIWICLGLFYSQKCIG